MQDKIIDLILKINKKYFFKKSHPFNTEKDGILNLNYSDFEYEHTQELLNMYEKITPPPSGTPLKKGRLEELFNNKEILEVGCGGGGKSVYIAEKYNSKVIGIDIEDIFLDQATRFARQKNVDSYVQFYKKSALDTGFKVDKFDVIIMSDVIEHIPETNILLDEMYRILKSGGVILFDFAPYYHYFGHHLWDTIQIPWIHLFFTDKFLIKLYKKSVENLIDGDARIDLRIGKDGDGKESFDYLNKITRKRFEQIMGRFVKKNIISETRINYYMLKEMNFLAKIPFLREIFIRHVVGYVKK